MKIHIDTSSAEEKAKAEKIATPSSSSGAKKSSSSSSSLPKKTQAQGQTQQGSTPSSQPQQQPQVPKKQMASKPPKEPKPTPEVSAARAQQTQTLKGRQQRETQGKMGQPVRDVDAGTGSGFYPSIYPLL